MTRSYAFLIGSLAAIWGASYLFIKVGVRDFSPPALMELRLAFQEVPDSLELADREPQRTVQRLFRNLRQEPSLARRPDGSLGP